jgi:hypothetical protein
VNQLTVELLAVRLALVLEELLTVIGGDDDEGVLADAQLIERVEDTAHLRVDP